MITSNPLIDRLKIAAERLETGCLEIKKTTYTGSLYLQDGAIVDAEVYGQRGEEAIFTLLNWTDCSLLWHKGATPYRQYIHLSVVETIRKWQVQFRAELERESEIEQTVSEPQKSAKLPEAGFQIKKYEVILRALDPLWQPAEYKLQDANKRSYVIGRGSKCDISLEHSSVQEMHCSLLIEDTVVQIWDLGTNGATHVNDQLVEEQALKGGDVISIGELEFKLHFRLRRDSKDDPAKVTTRPSPLSAPLDFASDFRNLDEPLEIQEEPPVVTNPPEKKMGLFTKLFGGK